MSNALTLFQNNSALPAHLAAFDNHDNILPRDTTPALTFRGKTWRLRQGGEEIVLTRNNAEGEKEPAPVVKVVVVNMNQKRSRMFYQGAYEEGKNQSPTCWSSDGERPDNDVPAAQKQAATCASCPNSVKGSKITASQKETTACSPVKRLAVVPASALDMEPLLLKVPQTSMWDKNNEEANAQGYFAWDQYVDFLRQRNVKHTAAVVTKIKFDPNTAYPKLLFTAERWLEASEVSKVVPLIESEAVQKLIAGKINEGGEPGDEEPAGAAKPAAPGPATASAAAPAASPAPVAAAAPLAAKGDPKRAKDDDGGDAFASVGKPAAAAPAKPATAAKAAAPAPMPPVPPKPPVVTPAASNDELAKLAAAWDD